MVLGHKQAVQHYIMSAMFGMVDSDVVARCKFPLFEAGYAGRVAWGATLDYRWILTASQLRKQLFPIVE